MTTLAEINNTLLDQNLSMKEMVVEQESTNDSIRSLVAKISEQMDQEKDQRLKDTAKKKDIQPRPQRALIERAQDAYASTPDGLLSGLFKGLGFGGGFGIAGFVSGLLSKVLGLIGVGAGKLIKTAALVSAVTLFGEDVINAIFGDGITQEQKADIKNALYATATWIGLGGKLITGLLAGVVSFLFPDASSATGGVLVDGFKSALGTLGFNTGWIDTAMGEHAGIIEQTLGAMAIAMVGRAVLLFGGKKILGLLATRIMTGVGLTAAITAALDNLKLPFGGTPTPDAPPSGDPTPAGGPRSRANPTRASRATARAAAKAAQRAADLAQYGRGKDLAKYGMTRNATGAMVDQTTKKFKSVDDLAAAILSENTAKAAKYSKFLKVVGPLGALVDLYDPLYAIYTDQPEEVIRKELVGTLGSVSGAYLGAVAGAAATTLIPVVGQSGIGNVIGGLLGAGVGAFAGEYTAESLADFLLGGPTPKPVTMEQAYSEYGRDLAAGAQLMPPSKPGPNDLESYSQYMQPPSEAPPLTAVQQLAPPTTPPAPPANAPVPAQTVKGRNAPRVKAPTTPTEASVTPSRKKDNRSLIARWLGWGDEEVAAVEKTANPTATVTELTAGVQSAKIATGSTEIQSSSIVVNPMKLSETTQELMRSEGEAVKSSMAPSTVPVMVGGNTQVTNNNVQQSSAMMIPQQPAVDLLDGGLALGARRTGPF